ncbi:probable carboxylesterase 2 [Tanacetum coccineum]
MVNDPLHIASSNHPGMMLTNTSFNRGKFLGWIRTIKMALGAMLKLGFIDGSSPKSVVIDGDYKGGFVVTIWKDKCMSNVLRGWGYLDWYKGKKNKNGKMTAQGGKIDLDQRMVAAVCQEMMKMFKEKGIDPSCIASTSQPHADTRAFDHMSPHMYLFHSIRVFKRPIKIKLPDETSKLVDKDPSTRKVLAVGKGLTTCTSACLPQMLLLKVFPYLLFQLCLPLLIKRSSTQPTWLKDFVISKHKAGRVAADNFTTRHPIYPLFQTHDFEQYPDKHVASLANVLAISEPAFYSQAVTNPKWIEAMNKRLQALETNDTWTLTELPSVAQAATIRVLIAIATEKGWPLHQLDVNNSFLHGFVDEEIYMKPLKGYTKVSLGQVCKLNKSLYGLKQASRQWNHKLSKFLVSLGFIQSKYDYSLYVKAQGDKFTVALVYVDDILLTESSIHDICDTKEALDKKLTIKDLGLARYFLGIEFWNPIDDAKSYRGLVGRFLYLSMTRPDISYVVQHLNQFVSSLKEPHLQVTMHLLRSLKGSINKGHCIFLGHSLVSWKTKKQPTVSRSSTEAEYESMAVTTYELVWLTYLLQDLHIQVQVPITLFCDNKAAQPIAANPCYHERTKHLDIDSHFTRDKVQEDFLQIAYIPTNLRLADIITKALGVEGLKVPRGLGSNPREKINSSLATEVHMP